MSVGKVPAFGTREVGAVSISRSRGAGLSSWLKRKLTAVKGLDSAAIHIRWACVSCNVKIFIAPDALYRLDVVGRVDIPSSNELAQRLYAVGVQEMTFQKASRQDVIERVLTVLSSEKRGAIDQELAGTINVSETAEKVESHIAIVRTYSLQQLLASPQHAMEAAEDPCTAPGVLAGLAQGDLARVRALVAGNPNTGTETLLSLCGRQDPGVLHMIAERCNEVPKEVVQHIVRGKFSCAVKLRIAQVSRDPGILAQLVALNDFPVLAHVKDNPHAAPATAAAAITKLSRKTDLNDPRRRDSFMRGMTASLDKRSDSAEVLREIGRKSLPLSRLLARRSEKR